MGRHTARQPCPFCGWEFTDLFEIGYRSRPRRPTFRVTCCSCRACGPEGESKEEAATLWNRGAPPMPDRVPIDFAFDAAKEQ